jgi:hypothetical protein
LEEVNAAIAAAGGSTDALTVHFRYLQITCKLPATTARI